MSTDQIDSTQPLVLSSVASLKGANLRGADDASFFARWLLNLGTLAVGLLSLGLLFRGTLHSIIATWHYGNYSHGYLIVPIACWLIWRERGRLRPMHPAASVMPVFLIALLGFAWLVGDVANANLIRQFAVVAMIPIMVWAILGRRIALTIWFPLTYLIFAVPMGDSLIPRLQDLTAWFVVSALQASGIPALLDGRFIYLSSGTWEVAQACSGIRYLISSLVLGVLFAHLVFRSWRRKLLFLAACVIVPIVANWIRAYSIVLFAHRVSRELAVGIDHVIYGLLFCSLVTFALFSVALSWREKEPLPEPHVSAGAVQERSGSKLSAITILVTVLFVLSVVRIWDYRMEHPGYSPAMAPLRSLSLPAPWRSARAAEPLAAKFDNADAQSSAEFSNGESVLQFQAVYYSSQRPGAELVSAGNGLDASRWTELSRKERHLGSLTFNECVLSGPEGRRLLWYWYWVGNRTVANSDRAKLYRAKAELLRSSSAAGAIFISTPASPADQRSPQELLADFVNRASLASYFDHLQASK